MKINHKDIINNAAAISYDPSSGKAPYLSALSRDSFEAIEIVKIAQQYGTPVQKSDILIKSLIKTEVGSEIPSDCFKHVAKLFCQIERVRKKALEI